MKERRKEEDEKPSLERGRKGPERGESTWSGSWDPRKSVIESSWPSVGCADRPQPDPDPGTHSRVALSIRWLPCAGSVKCRLFRGFPSMVQGENRVLHQASRVWNGLVPFSSLALLLHSLLVLHVSDGLRLSEELLAPVFGGVGPSILSWPQSQLRSFSRKQNWNYAVFTALWSTCVFI